MKKKLTALSIVLPFLFLFFYADYSYSYPRFGAYTGNKCMDCHVNPTGGLMRNKGGTYYAKKNLKMKMFKEIAGKTKFSPQISKNITLGGDVRVAQVDNEVDGSNNFNSFLAMQGDIYFNAELNKILSLFATTGIYIPGVQTEYEVYGLISNLPANTYMKIGRFAPNYGMRIVEHRAYQRQLILNTPYDANTGFELGVSPDWFNASIGLYNPMNASFLSQDPHKMFTGSMDFTFGVENWDYTFNFGGSFLNNPFNTRDTTSTSTITALKQAFGAFGKIGIMERVALLGELDFEESKSDRPLRRSLYWFGELDFIIIQGLELRGQYEYYDRNRDIEGDDLKRISTGLGIFPFYGFETELMVRFVLEEPDQSNNEWQWNFHFYF